MDTLDKVRVVIIGDSEAGKTSLAHLIAHGRPCERPMSTIGCSTQVKLHDYKAGTPAERSWFVELWDIGGSRGHENARSIFYNPVDGLLLVHDLSNKKSHSNLEGWLREVTSSRDSGKLRQVVTDYDPEILAGVNIPTLVIGTKLDHLHGSQPPPSYIAEDCSAEEVNLDATEARSLAAGTSNAVKLSRFFDRVIEKKLSGGSIPSPAIQHRDNIYFSPQDHRKRTYSPSRSYNKSSHMD